MVGFLIFLIKLIEQLEGKTVKSVLRYHVQNPHKQPEKYAHHLLFMFYPFHKESDLCSVEIGLYMEIHCDPVIKNIVNENKQKFEPFAELVDSTLTDYRTDLTRSPDAYAQQVYDEVSATLEHKTDGPEENEAPLFLGLGQLSIDRSTFMPDSYINSKIRSLNTKQR